ncbi:MAG: magnesium chelatase, partial [Acidobacteriota bacterium]|nr:magnesium chelatase [Acidobacteriota bacterium]
MKLALMLNAVHPGIGGVLIRGEKGTAKSTAVRGLARLLPRIAAFDGCCCHCDPVGVSLCPDCAERIDGGEQPSVCEMPAPMVNLPLGATEDMVLGAIDFEAAVKSGVS